MLDFTLARVQNVLTLDHDLPTNWRGFQQTKRWIFDIFSHRPHAVSKGG